VQVVTVTNNAAATMTVGGITPSTQFAQTNSCSTLGPGASCTINVTFTPTVEGALPGTLTIQTSNVTQW
jgi:hypothetical protein